MVAPDPPHSDPDCDNSCALNERAESAMAYDCDDAETERPTADKYVRLSFPRHSPNTRVAEADRNIRRGRAAVSLDSQAPLHPHLGTVPCTLNDKVECVTLSPCHIEQPRRGATSTTVSSQCVATKTGRFGAD